MHSKSIFQLPSSESPDPSLQDFHHDQLLHQHHHHHHHSLWSRPPRASPFRDAAGGVFMHRLPGSEGSSSSATAKASKLPFRLLSGFLRKGHRGPLVTETTGSEVAQLQRQQQHHQQQRRRAHQRGVKVGGAKTEADDDSPPYLPAQEGVVSRYRGGVEPPSSSDSPASSQQPLPTAPTPPPLLPESRQLPLSQVRPVQLVVDLHNWH